MVSGHPVPATVEKWREKGGKKDYGEMMSPLVDEKALEDFLAHAGPEDARRAAAALEAMAAAARLAVVDLETRRPRSLVAQKEAPNGPS